MSVTQLFGEKVAELHKKHEEELRALDADFCKRADLIIGGFGTPEEKISRLMDLKEENRLQAEKVNREAKMVLDRLEEFTDVWEEYMKTD